MKKERVDAKGLYKWILDKINSGEKMSYQGEWEPIPTIFFHNNNDKVFADGSFISFDDQYFSFGVETQDYIETRNGCEIKNIKNCDEKFKKEFELILKCLLNREEKFKSDYYIGRIKENLTNIASGKETSFYYGTKIYKLYNQEEEDKLMREEFILKDFSPKSNLTNKEKSTRKIKF